MREGSLDAPVRHPLNWTEPEFWDEANLDAEMRRIFDICHGCRRCFNLCDSFPRLFDLVDAAGDAELAGVSSAEFKPVVDACTLCDMCFMSKCPYVPPHPFDVDFPHLMLRYRAIEFRKQKGVNLTDQLIETDRNGKLAAPIAPVANWAMSTNNKVTRPLLEKLAGVDRRASLPKFHQETLVAQAKKNPLPVNAKAPAFGRKAVLYATCIANYNNPAIGDAARRVLAHNGVDCQVAYPRCCGMPHLERGDLDRVVAQAREVAASLKPYVDQGHDVVALVPSCSLMMKFEWPLLLPDDPDIKALAQATYDVSEYIINIARHEGLVGGLSALDGGVVLHLACHARAQNMGAKAADMLRLIPGIPLKVIERCSGHGGSWGVMKENFDVALKVGRPVARQVAEAAPGHVASECPLAASHIMQGVEFLQKDNSAPPANSPVHPIELMARAYGLL